MYPWSSQEEGILPGDTEMRILSAAMKAVRRYGLGCASRMSVSWRDSVSFLKNDRDKDVTDFKTFIGMIHVFKRTFPRLNQINQDLLWLLILTSTVMSVNDVAEGVFSIRETKPPYFVCWLSAQAVI